MTPTTEQHIISPTDQKNAKEGKYPSRLSHTGKYLLALVVTLLIMYIFGLLTRPI